MTTWGLRGPWRCSPKIAVPAWRPMGQLFSSVCRTCGYVGRGNGVPVGWRGSCGRRCIWTAFGLTTCHRAARERDATKFYRCWSRTG